MAGQRIADEYRSGDEEQALLDSECKIRDSLAQLRRKITSRYLCWAYSLSLFTLVLVFLGGFTLFHQILELWPSSETEQYPLNFLVIGDWGRNGFYNQSLVATQMGRVGERLDIDFVISVGDNFYDKGLTGVDDTKFTTSFTNIYTAPSLQKPWYTVLGNHDYMGDALAQLSQVMPERDPRWVCQREFQLKRSLCGSQDAGCSDDYDDEVEFFFIDTTPFINEYWMPNATRTFDWRGLEPRQEQLLAQVQRLDHSLARSDAKWKLVVGHHTMHSFGHHGDSVELLLHILPLLEKHGVDAYINGHDHCLEHIKHSDSKIHFITSGAGSKAWQGIRPATAENGLRFGYDGQGFLSGSMGPHSLRLDFHDALGHLLYTTKLTK